MFKYGLLAFFCGFCDQISKFFVVHSLKEGFLYPICPTFGFQLIYNEGISFGWLANPKWALLKLSLIVSVLLLFMYWFWLARKEKSMARGALALIIGGSLGNILDRIFFGKVIDFLAFSYGSLAFPVFNIADACISIGGLLLMVDYMRTFITSEKT